VYDSEPHSPVINDMQDDDLFAKNTTTVSDDSSDSSSSHDAHNALNKYDSPPSDHNNVAAHNDYYKRFVEFHRNPTMSRTIKPFATGRRHRHRTHKCKPCKRRRPCKKTIKRRRSHSRKRHYKKGKKGRKSHKRSRT
jgi:hypothetical protein